MTRSEQRRINVQRGRPMNEGLADCRICENLMCTEMVYPARTMYIERCRDSGWSYYLAPKEETKENNQ